MSPDQPRPVRLRDFQKAKSAGRPLVGLTCYDYLTAKALDRAELDFLLVGDSAAQVVCGHEDTRPITLEQMAFLAAAVARGTQRALVVVDLPFGAYEASAPQAIENACWLLKASGASAVKLEGGARLAPQITGLVSAGLAVMGHLGFTPQSLAALSGYRVQGKEPSESAKLIQDALRLEAAGIFALVLEMVPADLAGKISQRLRIPVIGVGAGAGVDGQLLVGADVLGLGSRSPRFARAWTNLSSSITEAASAFRNEVIGRTFPSQTESF